MKTELTFRIDENYPLPIHIQLQEQIKWLIGMEKLVPGDYLPPANELATQLNLNRNTINRVYSQLRDEGLVTLQKGKGTQVKESEQTERLIESRRELAELMKRICAESEKQGYRLKDILIATYAYDQLYRSKEMPGSVRVRFIARADEDHSFYRHEIERLTEWDVETIFLEDLSEDSTFVSAVEQTTDVMITTWRNKKTSEELFPNVKFVVIDAVAERSMLIDLSQVGLGSKIAFVSETKEGAEWMARQVENAGIAHIETIACCMDSLSELLYTIEQVDRVYVASTIYHQIKKIDAAKTFVFSLQLEQSSQTLLTNMKESMN